MKLDPVAARNSAFRIAARESRISDMERLLKKGADINSASDEGITALMYSAIFCRSGVASRLLELGADPNRRDKHGRTALLYAAIYNCNPCVKLLIATGGVNLLIHDHAERDILTYVRRTSELAEAVEAAIRKQLEQGQD